MQTQFPEGQVHFPLSPPHTHTEVTETAFFEHPTQEHLPDGQVHCPESPLHTHEVATTSAFLPHVQASQINKQKYNIYIYI